jgi:hypothetical protein
MDNIFRNMIPTLNTFVYPITNTNVNHKKQILDPMTCIMRLALLFFNKDGTKISISNNKIIYQPPNIFQGPFRWSNGDNRSDLHNLCEPIENMLLWYNTDNEIINKLLKYALKGLMKLKKSYNNDDFSNLVSHSLTHYMNLIENKIKIKKLKQNKQNNVDELKKELMINNIEKYDKISRLKKTWNENEITSVHNLLNLINDENILYIINAINVILEGKEEKACAIIIELMTTIS